MLILFDHGTPRGLARLLPEHTVITAKARGWDRLSNGDLLKAAATAAVDLLLTTDQKIRYQQNLTDRKIAIVVLAGSTKWSRVRLHHERIATVVNAATPGSYTEIAIPFAKSRKVFQFAIADGQLDIDPRDWSASSFRGRCANFGAESTRQRMNRRGTIH